MDNKLRFRNIHTALSVNIQYIKRRILKRNVLIYIKTKYYLKWRQQYDYVTCFIATSCVSFDIDIADDKEWFS
jgi:hypothetical protein